MTDQKTAGADLVQLADDVWNGAADAHVVADPAALPSGEIVDGVLMVPGFGNAFALRHDDGVVLFDTGSIFFAQRLFDDVRAWSDAPLTHAVYSHGHVDHVFGLDAFDAEADAAGRARATVIAHENVPHRFDRYALTQGYNSVINQRQFGVPGLQWPSEFRRPDVLVADTHRLEVGGLTLELRHYKGETDDALIGWLPDRKVLFTGDLFLGVCPNAGNPQKAQRYPRDWARALREMATLGAEVMLGGHNVAVVGAERVQQALTETAEYLESLVEQSLACINDGLDLDTTLQRVSVPAHLIERHFLQPLYDEPEFIVRAVWRQYAGWYDQNPATLKPAPQAELAAELAALAGGADVLSERAVGLAEEGSLRLARHLAQFAADADPQSAQVQTARCTVFAVSAEAATSTMATGIYRWAEAQSRAQVAGTEIMDELANPTNLLGA